ncbi:MAG: SufD family Fe-S cluster assembly protein [Pseudomonadota bacterium]
MSQIKPRQDEVAGAARSAVRSVADLPQDVRDTALSVGIQPERACRSGSFFHMDHSTLFSESFVEGLEIMPLPEALARYDWLRGLLWKLVDPNADDFTRSVAAEGPRGYFIRALPGARVQLPLQACLFIEREGVVQRVQNIVVAEEGSELNIITGCASGHGVRTGLHVGISEFYVRKGAQLTFTMIHNWGDKMDVRPRSGILVEEGATYLSNYVCLKPLGSLQMYPTVWCRGEGALTRLHSVLYAAPGTLLDIGGRVYLEQAHSRAEIISRSITRGGQIIARGHLIGAAPEVKGHLECRGLILEGGGRIHAIPELEANVEGVDLSHEAAVGKIAEAEIQYLGARGLSSEEAVSMIVRGFLDVDIKGLPEALREEIRKAIDASQDAM